MAISACSTTEVVIRYVTTAVAEMFSGLAGLGIKWRMTRKHALLRNRWLCGAVDLGLNMLLS